MQHQNAGADSVFSPRCCRSIVHASDRGTRAGPAPSTPSRWAAPARLGAYLHTRPERPPPLHVSAFHPGAARLAGCYGDGLRTMGDPETVKEVLPAYREGCEEAGRQPGEIVLEAMFSWAADDGTALEQARVWKGTVPPEYYVDDWYDPVEMYRHAEEEVPDEDFVDGGLISSDPEVHGEKIRELEELGATIVKLTNISGSDPLAAIRVYGEQVLPRLRG